MDERGRIRSVSYTHLGQGAALHGVRAQAALYLLVYEAVGDGVQLRERGGVAEHYLACLLYTSRCV